MPGGCTGGGGHVRHDRVDGRMVPLLDHSGIPIKDLRCREGPQIIGDQTSTWGSPQTDYSRILNHRDRDAVLRAARNTTDLKFQNAPIMIFPDYSRAIQQRRRSFEETSKNLNH